jgi:hypothetical protein
MARMLDNGRKSAVTWAWVLPACSHYAGQNTSRPDAFVARCDELAVTNHVAPGAGSGRWTIV